MQKRLLACCLVVIGLAGVVGPCLAAEFTKGGIKVVAPWSRTTPGGAKVGGGYLTITNGAKKVDRLIGGSLTSAERLEIHEMKMDRGIMRMRRLAKGIEIAAGQTVTLKPGGTHLMFIGLKKPIKLGHVLKGTLVFETAGTIEVEYQIAPLGATSVGGAESSSHKHH